MLAEGDPDDATTFGDLLRAYRIDANLTQLALSMRSGLSVQAIGMLERGERRSPRPGTLAMLTDGLRLDAGRAGALQRAARRSAAAEAGGDAPRPRPPEPRSGIPPDPIPCFAGRDAELARLARLLRQHGRVTVHGLGGVGKTQLVVQLLHRHGADYPAGRFWLRAEHETALLADLASLSWRLGLPEREEAEQERQIEAVLRWLRQHEGWLLVLDNLESVTEDAAGRWLGPGLAGHVVVTSRGPTGQVRLGLEPLPLEDSRDFLLERTGQDDTASAVAVAKALGCLPLALEQAAAYVENTGRDLAGYADLLRGHLVDLMHRGRPPGHPRPVATTWQLSFDRIGAEDPAAGDLLRLLAFLAPDDVPVAVLMAGAGVLPPRLRRALTDEVAADAAIAALRRYSLASRQGDRLRVHRLVQAVVRESLEAKQRDLWTAAAITVLRATFPPEPAEHAEPSPLSVRLLSHVRAIAGLTDSTVEPEALAWLLDRGGRCLWVGGELHAAREFLERAVALREGWLGDHLDTAESLDALGRLRQRHGELAAAQRVIERALHIRERLLGPTSSEVAESLNSLAPVLADQGALAAARAAMERTLAIREQVFGPDDLRVADTLNNLGVLLRMQGELAGARILIQRALDLREGTLGPCHPRTANSLQSLATLLLAQGLATDARPLLVRALDIRDQVLGPDHVVTADSLHQLAAVEQELGDLAAARSLAERAQQTLSRALGPEHRRTRQSARMLAEIVSSLENAS
jgi:tetratricopeptide (TPR) repeat protein/transcriptional regulator with XRE-family HTH domain